MFRVKTHIFGGELVNGNAALARAFAISLMVHFILVAGLELGRKAGLWTHSILPSWGQSRLYKEVIETAKQREEILRQQEQKTPEAQLVFIEVDPSQAVPEPPSDARYYSTRDTLAANPEPKSDADKPKIEGQQDKVPKLADVPRSAPAPQPPKVSRMETMQPSPPPKEQPRPKVEPAEEKGETLLARAAPRAEPRPEMRPAPEAPRQRPRNLTEARARRGIPGQRMKQEGGVRRFSLEVSENVKRSPFGDYDSKFIEAVQTRWFDLLEEREFLGNQPGKVVLEFRLMPDGRIAAMRVAESTVSELLSWLCQRAVLDPSPYDPFPPEIRRIMAAEYREIRFTFYYNQ